jgi:hypothetical protein
MSKRRPMLPNPRRAALKGAMVMVGDEYLPLREVPDRATVTIEMVCEHGHKSVQHMRACDLKRAIMDGSLKRIRE